MQLVYYEFPFVISDMFLKGNIYPYIMNSGLTRKKSNPLDDSGEFWYNFIFLPKTNK